jgi:hypothetical protein
MKNDDLEGGHLEPMAQPRMVRLRMDVVIDWKLATRIHALLKRAETEPVEMILRSEGPRAAARADDASAVPSDTAPLGSASRYRSFYLQYLSAA